LKPTRPANSTSSLAFWVVPTVTAVLLFFFFFGLSLWLGYSLERNEILVASIPVFILGGLIFGIEIYFDIPPSIGSTGMIIAFLMLFVSLFPLFWKNRAQQMEEYKKDIFTRFRRITPIRRTRTQKPSKGKKNTKNKGLISPLSLLKRGTSARRKMKENRKLKETLRQRAAAGMAPVAQAAVNLVENVKKVPSSVKTVIDKVNKNLKESRKQKVVAFDISTPLNTQKGVYASDQQFTPLERHKNLTMI
jgi:hypothetical protein